MKYSVDTYRLYQSEKYFAHTVRVHVRMKDEVDIKVLDKAVNKAITVNQKDLLKVSKVNDSSVLSLFCLQGP